MRRVLVTICLGACFATAVAQDADEPVAGHPAPPENVARGESAGRLELGGLSELRFHPLRGSLRAELRGAGLSDAPGSVQVLINGTPVAGPSLTLSRSTIAIDYAFRNGLNEVLITALDRDGALLTADALLWAGDASLVVDVVDAGLEPVDGAEVSIALAEATSVQQRAVTRNGTARFENLPDRPLIVSARHRTLGSTRTSATARSGSLLLQLGE